MPTGTGLKERFHGDRVAEPVWRGQEERGGALRAVRGSPGRPGGRAESARYMREELEELEELGTR